MSKNKKLHILNAATKEQAALRRYKQIKKHLNITDTDIARIFGYSSVHSFRNAARKEQIVKGIVELSELFKTQDEPTQTPQKRSPRSHP